MDSYKDEFKRYNRPLMLSSSLPINLIKLYLHHIIILLIRISFTFMSTDHIQKEIQDYENLVEELRCISKDMTDVLRPQINEIIGTEKDGFSIKQYVLENGIPIASSDELYSICSYEKLRDYILEQDNIDEKRATVVVLAVLLSFEFYQSVGIPMTDCLATRRPELVIFYSDTCMAPEDIECRFTDIHNNKGNSLRNIFEKLKQYKATFTLLLQSLDPLQEPFEEMSEQDYIEFNDFADSVLDEDYDLFKRTAIKIVDKIGMREFVESCEKIITMSPLVEVFNLVSEGEIEPETEICDKYFSMNGISISDISCRTPTFCRTMFNYNLSAIITIDNLPPEAKKAIESFWEESDISWLKEPFKKWAQDEFQIIKKSVQKENKKPKTREKTKPDHLNVVGSTRMIRLLAEGLVQGNDAPYLPKLVSSSRGGKKDAINKLVYLFTGETDDEVKLPYNLVWNDDYCLNGLRLLIYLMHFSGEFKDNDPLNALDDNDKTGISEVIKFKNTGRRPVFPIVEKAFCTGDKSVQNAKKPKGGNREFLEQIIKFWWYCKNSDTAATE